MSLNGVLINILETSSYDVLQLSTRRRQRGAVSAEDLLICPFFSHIYLFYLYFPLSPPCRADATAAVEVAAELREVDGGRACRWPVEAEVPGRHRPARLLDAGERREDVLLLLQRRGRKRRRGR